MALITTPLLVLALCLDTGQRVKQYGKAQVFSIQGHPMILYADKNLVPLHSGALSEETTPVTISTDKDHVLMLTLADSRLQLAPASSLRITQMSYNGTRQRRMELLNGTLKADIEPEAEHNLPGYYDLICGDTLVQAQPTETATTVALSVHPDGVRVRLAQGAATIIAQGLKKQLPTGYQLVVQTDKPLNTLSVMPLKDSQQLLAGLGPQPAAQAALLAHWRGLYTQAQQRTLMPLAAQAMTLLQL